MTSQASVESARICRQVAQFGRLREGVLVGDVWKQPEMSNRDRILVTFGVLDAFAKIKELKHYPALYMIGASVSHCSLPSLCALESMASTAAMQSPLQKREDPGKVKLCATD